MRSAGSTFLALPSCLLRCMSSIHCNLLQGVVTKTPSTELLGPEFDCVYLEYYSGMLAYPLLADFSKYKQIHVSVDSDAQDEELSAEAESTGWNVHVVAERGEMKLICLSRKG